MSICAPHPAPRLSAKTPAELTASINPPPRRRLAIILAFPLLILLAVPFWWYTTSIERLPLPEGRISALEGANVCISSETMLGHTGTNHLGSTQFLEHIYCSLQIPAHSPVLRLEKDILIPNIYCKV